MLVWLDLETTGLNEFQDTILEIACIVTDDELNEHASFERTVYFPDGKHLAELPEETAIQFAQGQLIDPYVVKMHRKNGLWDACAEATDTLESVDLAFAKFLRENSVRQVQVTDEQGNITLKEDKPQLAGSTISFDRAFMKSQLPKALDMLHYRNLDVSSFNEVARRWWKDLHKTRPNAGRAKEDAAHRGMADIKESIQVLKYYLNNLIPSTQSK